MIKAMPMSAFHQLRTFTISLNERRLFGSVSRPLKPIMGRIAVVALRRRLSVS
jgi:hypothetical protein